MLSALTLQNDRIMATVILQVPDESLVSKVKQACKMLMGVTSVTVKKEEEPYLIDPETGKRMKQKYVKEIEDAMNGIGVKTYASVGDFFKEMGIAI